MAKKVIFRKIRGRIIPIIKKGTQITKSQYKSSPAIRKALKGKIAAKTSLRGKRIKAIRAVSKYKKHKLFKLGDGIDMFVYKAKNQVVKVPEARAMSRFNLKTFLSGKKLAPETFMVSTSKKDYLVQKKIIPIDKLIPRNFASIKTYKLDNKYGKWSNVAWTKRINKFIKRTEKYGIEVKDTWVENLGINIKTSKKVKSIDSGEYRLKSTFNKLNEAIKKRRSKFWIRKKK